MFCSKCGSDNQDDLQFCTSCGYQLKEGSSIPLQSLTTNHVRSSEIRYTNHIFLDFIVPYLSTIDDGGFFRKPMVWLYMLMAVLNFIAPLYIFYQAAANQIFQAPAKFIITFVLVWIIIAFACWLGFQIWWNRKDKVSMTTFPDNDFLATPVFSHFVQTLGEWLGTLVAVIGSSFSLLVTIILGSEGNYLSQVLGIWFLNNSVISIIVMPIYGFLIIVIGRVFAETLRALVSIVKNTKKS